MPKQIKVGKKIQHLIEALALYLFYFIMRCLSINLTAKIFRSIFSLLPKLLKENKVANANLKMCFPKLSISQRKKILAETWQHFGSIIGEFAHWHDMSDRDFAKRVKIINPEKIPSKNAIIISAHLGNWELVSRIFNNYKYKINLLYRPMNNPFVNNFICSLRANKFTNLIPKGRSGVKQIVDKIHRNEVIGLLVDQKLNEGIKVPFFDKEAMTTSLPANLALKYKIPLIPANIIRVGEAKYRVELFDAIKIKPNDTKETITLAINKVLEDWIKNNPNQWFWFHNRWNIRK